MPDPHRRKLTGGHYKDTAAAVRGYAAKVLPPSDTAGTKPMKSTPTQGMRVFNSFEKLTSAGAQAPSLLARR